MIIYPKTLHQGGHENSQVKIRLLMMVIKLLPHNYADYVIVGVISDLRKLEMLAIDYFCSKSI